MVSRRSYPRLGLCKQFFFARVGFSKSQRKKIRDCMARERLSSYLEGGLLLDALLEHCCVSKIFREPMEGGAHVDVDVHIFLIASMLIPSIQQSV
jgi:hypothetical protein